MRWHKRIEINKPSRISILFSRHKRQFNDIKKGLSCIFLGIRSKKRNIDDTKRILRYAELWRPLRVMYDCEKNLKLFSSFLCWLEKNGMKRIECNLFNRHSLTLFLYFFFFRISMGYLKVLSSNCRRISRFICVFILLLNVWLYKEIMESNIWDFSLYITPSCGWGNFKLKIFWNTLVRLI